jgi:8-oxo-dGTP diphosphatase
VSEAESDGLEVVAAVIRRGPCVLMTRRPPGGSLGLLWEFPGGKLEEGESLDLALVRELREELGVGVVPQEMLWTERHRYENGLSVVLRFVACELDSEDFTPGPGVHEVRWVRPSRVDPGEVVAADRGFLAWLAASR